MLDLFRTRVDLYKGATVPPEPTAELNATRFLAHPAVSPLQTKPQRLTTIQAMSDLVGLAAQHVQDADAQQRDALVLVIEGTTKAMWVAAADLKGNPAAVQAIQSALEPAMKITPQTPAAEVPGIVKGIFDPLAAHPDLKGITAPPTVEKPAEAPQVPAGQATTTRGAGGQ
jgi:hypothetical protein